MKMNKFVKIMNELLDEGIEPHYSHFQMNLEKYLEHLKKYEIRRSKEMKNRLMDKTMHKIIISGEDWENRSELLENLLDYYTLEDDENNIKTYINNDCSSLLLVTDYKEKCISLYFDNIYQIKQFIEIKEGES